MKVAFTRVKDDKVVVRRRDENSLLALFCLTIGNAFDWDRVSVIVKGTTRYTRDFYGGLEWCVTLDPGYRALRH